MFSSQFVEKLTVSPHSCIWRTRLSGVSSGESSLSSNQRILLVEDSETQALRLQFLFAEQGWQTERASTAEEAVDKLNRIVPDLIILDYYLPGLKGVELCKSIRLNATGWNPPILMFTAEDAFAVQRESLESGADDYLSKSADDSILVLRVRTLLRKSETNLRTVGRETGYSDRQAPGGGR